MKYVILTAMLCVAVLSVTAQEFWQVEQLENLPLKTTKVATPNAFAVFKLTSIDGLKQRLLQAPDRDGEGQLANSPIAVALPMPDGTTKVFEFYHTPIMAPELQATFPQIKTYTGVSSEGEKSIVKIDFTDHGFHGMIVQAGQPTIFINPYRIEANVYMSFFKNDFPSTHETFVCHTAHVPDESFGSQARQAGDCTFRRYRLALACTGEYAQFHGGTVSTAMSAMVVSMNRVNGIYEMEVGLTMQLIGNNDQLIYLDGNTDPYTNSSGSTMLGQNQTNIDNVIGTANYDVGHVFSTGGGGIASLRSPCNSNRKARGVTGRGAPVGDPFDVDYVAHEFGHQWGGNHTQNNNCNRVSSASYEPGSASTIMGYAGICIPNVQSNSDAYFHAVNIGEIADFVTNAGTGGSCDEIISSNNNAPSVDALVDYAIPHSTAFALTAIATDPDSDPLTYCWEQYNAEYSTQPPQPTNDDGPNFRSLSPTADNTREFPERGFGSTWEVLSSVQRTMDFRVTVRDFNSALGYGCTDEADMEVNIQNNNGVFAIEIPAGGEVWNGGAAYDVLWNVAGTTASPISCAQVAILLSIDDGYTYPYTLLATTANDGSATVTLPNISTTEARIRVTAVGNVFFDVTDGKFTIQQSNNCPNDDLVFDSTPISSGSYYANNTITASVSVASNGNVFFQSNVINLNPDFEVPLGAEFEAVNGACP